MYYCSSCIKLHRWDPDWNIDHQTGPRRRCKDLNYSGSGPRYDCRDISHELVRLVLNRHLYGPSHGLPLTSIEKDHRYIWEDYGVVQTHTTRARIIDGELFIRSTNTIWHDKGSAEELRYFVDLERDDRIQHEVTAGLRNYHWPHEHPRHFPEVRRPADEAEGLFVECEQSLRSCTTCETDLETDLTWTGKREGWTVRVVGYHRLGGCRDLAGERQGGMFLSRIMRGDEGGRDLSRPSVRSRWLAQDGRDALSDGETKILQSGDLGWPRDRSRRCETTFSYKI